jgi:Ca-activated chloride channel family protein
LVTIIEKERETGISLSVLGFGRGNYQDAKMEKLADNGNGNYAYIDQLLEAKRVFVNEVGGTLNTIAKDVKLQVEFNPAKVKSYRLIGYENRHLEAEDFDDDKKDAGELGAGHSVTALYEIEPAVAAPSSVGALRYLQQSLTTNAASAEFLTVKFRYKAPNGDVSQLIEHPCAAQPIELAATSENFRFSAAVAAFAMLLRESEHKGNATFEQVLAYGRAAKGVDANGYRAEFLKLVETAALLTPGEAQR